MCPGALSSIRASLPLHRLKHICACGSKARLPAPFLPLSSKALYLSPLPIHICLQTNLRPLQTGHRTLFNIDYYQIAPHRYRDRCANVWVVCLHSQVGAKLQALSASFSRASLPLGAVTAASTSTHTSALAAHPHRDLYLSGVVVTRSRARAPKVGERAKKYPYYHSLIKSAPFPTHPHTHPLQTIPQMQNRLIVKNTPPCGCLPTPTSPSPSPLRPTPSTQPSSFSGFIQSLSCIRHNVDPCKSPPAPQALVATTSSCGALASLAHRQPMCPCWSQMTAH